MLKTILYARISTTDQTAAHQRTQAEKAGFTINAVVVDEGVSGISTRLGRDYQDVTDTIREMMKRGVVVRTVINNLTFDGATTDPMQKAVRDAPINFMAATAQAQAEATKEAQRAGIARAKGRDDAYRGRKPSYTRIQLDIVRAQLTQGASVSAIARDTGLSRQTIYRIQEDPAEAEAALARWAA